MDVPNMCITRVIHWYVHSGLLCTYFSPKPQIFLKRALRASHAKPWADSIIPHSSMCIENSLDVVWWAKGACVGGRVLGAPKGAAKPVHRPHGSLGWPWPAQHGRGVLSGHFGTRVSTAGIGREITLHLPWSDFSPAAAPGGPRGPSRPMAPLYALAGWA